MILQKDVFFEDESEDTHSIIGKYFPDTVVISDENVMLGNVPKGYSGPFRGSLFLATRLGRRFDFCDAIEWAPSLREHMISRDFFFQDASQIVKSFDKMPVLHNGRCFIRPTRGNKVFSGNVYGKETFSREVDFFSKSKNESPYILCMLASPQIIKKEWRILFVGGEYCGSSQYMANGEREIDAFVPEEVISFSQIVSKNDYFQNIFDFVIDIGESSDSLGLVEINSFETASFYGANLDTVYSKWAKSLK